MSIMFFSLQLFNHNKLRIAVAIFDEDDFKWGIMKAETFQRGDRL